MTPEEAVLTRIGQLASVTALVGDRTYMLRLPQNEARPSIVVQNITDLRDSHFRGGSKRGRARIQVDVHVSEASGVDPYSEASEIADALNGNHAGDALAGWRGTLGSPSLMVEELRFVQRLAPIYEAGAERSVRIIQEYFVFYLTD